MKHVGTQTIRTGRLVLRRFTLDDAEAMYKNWASDSEVTRFLTWPTHASPDVTRTVLESWVENYAKPDYYQWAIVPADGDEPVGGIAVVAIDERIGKCEIGYCLGRGYWRRGIMTEALNAVIDFMFEEAGANRVEARHDVNNPNSGAVMRKCGMKYEGTLRQADINNQGICDVAYYGILRCEWQAQN